MDFRLSFICMFKFDYSLKFAQVSHNFLKLKNPSTPFYTEALCDVPLPPLGPAYEMESLARAGKLT